MYKTPLKKHQRIVHHWKLQEKPIRSSFTNPSTRMRLGKMLDLQKLREHPLLQEYTLTDKTKQEKLDTIKQLIYDCSRRPNRRHHKPWFDDECKRSKQRALQALHIAMETETETNFSSYDVTRKEYRKLIRDKRERHNESQLMKIIGESNLMPWKLLPKKKFTMPQVPAK